MLSVIIPAYNEELNINNTLVEITNLLTQAELINNYEIIVVDDHSSDNTYEIVQNFLFEKVNCIRLSKRSGSHNAIRTGLLHAKGSACLCISADGQDNPQIIKEMLKKWQKGTDIVWGLRKSREDEPLIIKFFALLFYQILNALIDSKDNKMDLARADFYLLDKKVINAINSCPERNTSLFGLIAWIGFKQDYVEYDRRKRKFGESKWNFHSRFRLAKDWIIAFSGLPLRLMTYIGFTTAFLGFLYALFIVINAINGNPAQGWSSLMVAILIIGGSQMAMLGVIGEYLWRNLDESRKRPICFVEKSTLEMGEIHEQKHSIN